MGIRLDSPEEVITFPPMESIPDGPEDKPTPAHFWYAPSLIYHLGFEPGNDALPDLQEEKIGPFDLPELISGAATWSHFYNEKDKLSTDVPLRTIRLALRYGIRAFDTSPYYDNSEIVLGTALKALENEFPRDTYRLLTKVGRYGPSPGTDPSATDFDYSPSTIRRSVHRSLQRLHTHYLDVVYLHDIEFVAPCVAPRAEGNHLDDDSDGRILEAVSELRALQAEGLIRQIGISALRTHARVSHVLAASPLGMGLLLPPPIGPPAWHPAPDALRAAVREAVCALGSESEPGRQVEQVVGVAVAWMPVVVGLSNLREVHETVAAWRWANDPDDGRREELERKAALAHDGTVIQK
ncbi:NADP-dependent oxidoreductase domain-containing protein [Russula vinacea]|nr:NADP-dependent oxidoreductase domain-containing protein [Russula vinacea]